MKTYALIHAALAAALLAGPVHAGGVAHHASQGAAQSGQSVQASAQAVGHVGAGSAKLASAAVAVPFIALGYLGEASSVVGDALWDAASAPAPLEVSPETVTAGPAPHHALLVNR